MAKQPMKLVMCSDDPDTILSYGILSQMLIDQWKKYYHIDYCSLQYQMGMPIQRVNYVKHPAHNQGERNPTYLPRLLNKVKPDVIWTNFDVQHYQNVKKYIPRGASWVGWIPWDNHDLDQMPRARDAFSNVDIRIAISRFGFEFLNQAGVRMDDYIYNIIDTDVYKPLAKDHKDILEFKKRNKWYNDEMKLLLFVGRPNWRKRMIHLFAIIQELKRRGNKNFKLFIHSNLDDPAKTADLREIILAMDIEDCLIMSPFPWDSGIPKEDLRVIYNMATLYIAPHGGEGFGMPIGEAMACGTPFIASDICTTREFAGENFERGIPSPVMYPKHPNGQIRKDKGVARPYPVVQEFANRIEELWNDKKRMEIMGKNGVKWVNENCSPRVVADKWKEVIDTYDIPIIGVHGYK
jgi:glycosyltransferase involved in cell wall biosynthesis